QEEWVRLESGRPPPPVGVADGPAGVLELLEHIRAAQTGDQPRPGASPRRSRGIRRVRRSLATRRRR
ncbi:MAG: hypothetical protein ACRDQA_06895, partial [Nocardioidaceae bacterium]